jgi:hypothetical protein
MPPGDPDSMESETAPAAARPRVIEAYWGYTPPFSVAPVVEKMLASVPPEYLVQLSEVVLTNTAGLARKLRRKATKSRGRKVRFVEARGLYHHARISRPAWIEIYVDNCLKNWQRGWWRWWLKFPVLREAGLAGVLFHEIGHHIHATVRPEFREREDVADVWKVRLLRIYNRGRPFWVEALLFPIGLLFGIRRRRLERRMFQEGIMSRAEFEERRRR